MPKTRTLDLVLLTTTMATAAVGVAMVGSASGPLAREHYHLPEYEFAIRQLAALLVGVCGLLAATFVPLDRIMRLRLALPMLGATWAALGFAFLQARVAGTHRWLQLPVGSVQPSSVAKVTLPIALAALYAWQRSQRRPEKVVHAAASLITGVTVGLVLLEPDLGSAVLLLVAAATVLLLADMPWRYLTALGTAAALVFLLAIALKPYRVQRMRSFFGDTGYQVQQSLIALGGGGLLGRGPGGSVQKLFFLPQPHTDFIFAVIGEEFGLLGTVMTLTLLGVIVARGLAASRRANTFAAALLAGGLTATIAVQALLNVSVCLKLLPAKGLPLPLISSGGSDLVLTLVAIGLVLNVGKEGM